MRRLMFIATTLAFLLCAAQAHAEDVVTLSDGRTVMGKIVKENNETVFVQQADGDERGILRSRISKIERNVAPPAPAPGETAEEAKVSESVGFIVTEIKDLGSPDPDVRNAAMAKLLEKPKERVPLMLALLHPKKKDADEFTRIGIIRTLVQLAPLEAQISRVLAYSAVFDPFMEVKREACAAIRELGDDTAVRELIRYAGSEDANIRRGVAAALREIDDNRVFESLLRSIPAPAVTANLGPGTGAAQPERYLPIGPNGVNMPIYLPQQEVSGTATDIDSPAAQLLKLIANKNLGSHPLAWMNWYREKTGNLTQAERESYKEKRSMLRRMNVPTE